MDPGDGRAPRDMHGIVTTYQQVASVPRAFARFSEGAFVILDEIHHVGDDRAWGDSLLVAFAAAGRRLALSGTPFTSDTRSIPFVRYEVDEARPDFEYGYGPALADVVSSAPSTSHARTGTWSGPRLMALSTQRGSTDALTTRANQRLRAALSIDGEWLPEVLSAAQARLSLCAHMIRRRGALSSPPTKITPGASPI